MNLLKSWVYIDYTNNIWKFSVNSDNGLEYSIMFKEGKWTKKKLIDQNVLDYYIYAEKNDIHIIYSNNKAELKYCTLIEQQWRGRTLYGHRDKKVKISNLNVLFFDNDMHIFFLLTDMDSNEHGSLMHCKWNGKEIEVNGLQNLIIASDLNEHYLVHLDESNNIEMLFFSDQGNEISLYQCSYKNRKWTQAMWLYGISGEDIKFKMLSDTYGIHVLNKIKENSDYYLIHVFIKKDGAIDKSYLHRSMNPLIEPILYKKSNELYANWMEDNKIYSSFYKGNVWSNPICLNKDMKSQIYKYYYTRSDDNRNNQVKEVYGTDDNIDFNLIMPGEIYNLKEKSLSVPTEEDNEKNTNNEELLQKDNIIKVMKSELYNLESEIKVMKQTIASLNTKLQKTHRIQNEYEEQISKVNHYKKKTEENYNIFMEVQEKLQNDLEELKQKYEEEKVNRESLEIKYKECEEEKNSCKEQIDILIEENNKLSKDNKSVIRFWKH